jgi:hypothetical protein
MGRLVVWPEPCKFGLKSRSRVLRPALDPTESLSADCRYADASLGTSSSAQGSNAQNAVKKLTLLQKPKHVRSGCKDAPYQGWLRDS